ncbi:nuclear transport factor 2 family protein [Streptomyces sp. PLAI1-29]|uniref:Nuclear transport factor 2 family protein n=2 Tax=Streptomyces zingiberis TaxID=2053010 RepID=A0ABX1C0Z3_9ACTN|nr:nuclear transport factor 2 family protein [Streptomyces zingiberis]
MPAAGAGFTPGEEDLRSVTEWFARYDALAARGEVEAMAGMALFPLNVVTDDAAGEGSAESWDRERFTATMGEVTAGAGGDSPVTFESVRTPHFLTASLVLVVTDAVMTAGGHRQAVRYADLLVKRDGAWRFQTMIQGGWGGAGDTAGAA